MGVSERERGDEKHCHPHSFSRRYLPPRMKGRRRHPDFRPPLLPPQRRHHFFRRRCCWWWLGCLVAGFGAGCMDGVVCGESPIEVFADGIMFSLMSGGIFKVEEKLSQQKAAEDALYKNGRSMLSSLGLDHFEKNFKQGLFTDKTLPLLTDSDLQEVKIPPGPRRLILDHIQRDKEVKKED